jgi:dTDP-4-dehydrorhamnose 3,5-epimerase
MEFVRTHIPDVILVKPRVFGDERGFFLESWHEAKFAAGGIDARFVQDNHSRSTRNTVRGLHYQIRQPQAKLVRVTRGSVFDVVVDLRRSSPTFGRWIGVELSAATHEMLFVPAGFAHGFLALEEGTEFQYKCTDYYAPEYERVIAWNDPDLAIQWSLPAGESATLSSRDAAAGSFRAAELFP